MTARLARLAGVPVTAFAAGILAIALTGCPSSNSRGGFVTTTNSTALLLTSGNNQTGIAGAPLANPLVVTLVNGSGQAVSGQTVTFTVAGGGGTVSAATAITNALGQASTGLKLGPAPGANSVLATASVSGVTSGSLAVTFSETASSGAAASIAATSGATQTVNAGVASSPLIVTVTDASGNPVAGSLVLFNITSGSGVLGSPTAVTNSSGQAQTTVTPSATGTLTVVATVANATGSSVTFTLTVNPASGPSANPAIAFKVPGTTQIPGTVLVSNTLNTVTGTGTTFTSTVAAGAQIFFASQPGTTYTVQQVNSDTLLTLTSNYNAGTNASGVSLTILGFCEPRGVAVSQSTNALWFTAVYNGTIGAVASPNVVIKTTKTGGNTTAGGFLSVNTAPIVAPSLVGVNLAEPVALALSKDEKTLYILDIAFNAAASSGTGTDTPTGAILQTGANGGPVTVLPMNSNEPIDAPTAMVLSTDGQKLYVTGHDQTHHAAVFGVDVTAATTTILASGAPLVQPTGVGISTDGKTLYVADSNSDPSTGNAQLFSLAASGGVGVLSALASGGIVDATRAGGGVVPGFDGGINVAAFTGAQGKVTSVQPVTGSGETVRFSSTGSGPLVTPFQIARDGSNLYTVDSEATGSGCVVVSQ